MTEHLGFMTLFGWFVRDQTWLPTLQARKSDRINDFGCLCNYTILLCLSS